MNADDKYLEMFILIEEGTLESCKKAGEMYIDMKGGYTCGLRLSDAIHDLKRKYNLYISPK